MLFTDKGLQAEIRKPLPAGKSYINHYDLARPGLALRVGAKGAKGKATWYAVGRGLRSSGPTWHMLGQYPTMGLAEAWTQAQTALELLKAGKDPKTEKQKQRAAEDEAERERQDNTFASVAARFNAQYATMTSRKTGRLRKTAGDTAQYINRELVSVWGGKPITDITEADVRRVIRAIVARGTDLAPGKHRRTTGGHNAARHTFAAAGLLFKWARREKLITVNPCADLEPTDLHNKAVSRDRVLSDKELRAVWRGAEQAPYPYGPLIQLLVLTGTRRDEMAGASWGEIEGDVLVIPAHRMKGKAAHSVPLPPLAMEILSGLPRFTAGDYLFSSTLGERPISGFSQYRDKFDRLVDDIPHWTLHDLRRTCRTGLSSVGVLPMVAELVIGHAQQGISAVYDRHRYDDEKRAALELWEARVRAVVGVDPEPQPEKVVRLNQRRA